MNASNAKDYMPLVKALADGKVIQTKTQTGKWKNLTEVDWLRSVEEYRVRPEPQEFWANRYPDGSLGPALYFTREDAKKCATPKSTQVRYREVIE